MNNQTMKWRRPSTGMPGTRRQRGRCSLAGTAFALVLLLLLEVTPTMGYFMQFPLRMPLSFDFNPKLRHIEDQIEHAHPVLTRSRRNEDVPPELVSFFDMISHGEGVISEEDSSQDSSRPFIDSNAEPECSQSFDKISEEDANSYSYIYPFPYPYFYPMDQGNIIGPDYEMAADPTMASNSMLSSDSSYDHDYILDQDSDCMLEPDMVLDPVSEEEPNPSPDFSIRSDPEASVAMEPKVEPLWSEDQTAAPSVSPTADSNQISVQSSNSTVNPNPESFSDPAPNPNPESFSEPAPTPVAKPKRRPPPVDPRSIVVDEHVEELEEDLLGSVLEIFSGPRVPSKNKVTIFDMASTVLKAVESNKEDDVRRAKMKPEEKEEMFRPRRSEPGTHLQTEDNSPPGPKLLDITKAVLRMVKTDKKYEVREARKRDALRRAQEALEKEYGDLEELVQEENQAADETEQNEIEGNNSDQVTE